MKAILGAFLLAAASPILPSALASEPSFVTANAHAEFDRLLNDVWVWKLEHNPALRMQRGMRVERLPTGTFAEAQELSNAATGFLQRIHQIPRNNLSDDQQLTLETLRREMVETVEGERYFWMPFTITPYRYNFFVNGVHPVFASFRFQNDDDAQLYLTLAEEYASAIENMSTRLQEQERRGILLPSAAMPRVIELFSNSAAAMPAIFHVDNSRLTSISSARRARFTRELDTLVSARIVPAYLRIPAYLRGPYSQRAPSRLGVGQYPGGAAFYRYLIRSNTTLDLTPRRIHRLGLQRMAELETNMAAIRRRLGFTGTKSEFHDYLRTSPQFRAASAERLEQIYNECLQRMQPHLPALFAHVPRSPYAVARVRREAEAGMTFGYYQRPDTPGATGYYYYNGSNLDQKPTFTACAMIYHELVPGHHFHIASQEENGALHPLQSSNLSFTAFNEGWAEYAASLGIEVGAYDDPYSLYGRYLNQSHVYARLVVDTGLNALGWSAMRAENYLRDHTLLTDSEIQSELLRYSTDLPGQALAYGVGFEKIWELRRRAQRALGPAFDIRAFHEVILGAGAMPLPVLEMRVRDYIHRTAGTRT